MKSLVKNKTSIYYSVVLGIGITIAFIIASIASGFAENINSLGGSEYVYNTSIVSMYNIEENSGVYFIKGEGAFGVLSLLDPNKEKYKYVVIDLKEQNLEKISSKLEIENSLNEVFLEKEVLFENGKAIVELPSITFKNVKLFFEAEEKTEFMINKIQYRSSPPFMEWGKFGIIFAVTLIIYCIVYIIIKIRGDKIFNFNPIMEALVSALSFIFNRIYGQKQIKNRRVADAIQYLLLFILTYAIYYNEITYAQNYLIGVAAISVVLLLLPITMNIRNIQVDWNNTLAYAWYSIAFIEIVSQFIVEKELGFVGYFRILVLGIFFVAWSRSECKERLYERLSIVAKVTFVPVIIKCLFMYDSEKSLARYEGIYGDSNEFAIYALFVLAMIVASMDKHFFGEKIKVAMIGDFILFGFVSCLLWWTQGRAGLIGAMIIVLLAMIKWFVTPAVMKNKRHVMLSFVILTIIVGVVWNISKYALITFSLDGKSTSELAEYPLDTSINVNASGIVKSRLLQKIDENISLDRLSTGRISIWDAYLRKINIWGNTGYAYVDYIHQEWPSHNAILGMIYKNGIFIAIPYIIMIVCMLVYSLKYFVKNAFKNTYSLYPISIVIAFGVFSMLDNIEERPFWKLLWLAFYLTAGFLMSTNLNKNNKIEDYNSSYGEKAAVQKEIYAECNKFTKKIAIVLILVILMGIGKSALVGIIDWENSNSKDCFEMLSQTAKKYSVPVKKLAQEVVVDKHRLSEMDTEETIQLGNVYYRYQVKDKGIYVSVSYDNSNWEEKELTLFDHNIDLVKSIRVIYAAPYWYMFYLNEDVETLVSSVGLLVSNDGVNWDKLNVKGSFGNESITRFDVKFVNQQQKLYLYVLSEKNEEMKCYTLDVSQKRDMTCFNTESDWSESAVASQDVFQGSYAIEGERGSKNVWLQKESSIDLYYLEGAQFVTVSGYMPFDIYEQKGVKEVTVAININGQLVAERVFCTAEKFEIEIPIDNISEKNNFMHIELVVDNDFNPQQIGVSEDGRDLSFILYSIMQK